MPSATTLAAPAQVTNAVVRRARRLMLTGLVVTVIGTRLIDGGISGLVAAGVFPLTWIAIFSTYEKALGAATPLFAVVLRRFDPARFLVLSDFAEGAASLLALVGVAIWPHHVVAILIPYMVLVSILPTIGDLAEEYYGQQLAQHSAGDALAFNANVFSMLTFISLVFAMPLGALGSGISIIVLLALNALLSLGGFGIRFRSMRTLPTAPLTEQDLEEVEGVTGVRMKFAGFLNDLLRSGPASPAMSLALNFVSGLTGTYLFLWAAHRFPGKASAGMAVMLMVFGVGATIGPQLARMARRHFRQGVLLTAATAASIVNIAGLALVVHFTPHQRIAGWIAAIAFVILSAVLSRARIILISTLRQTTFKGRQFSNIMSWSYAFSALGTLLGLWTALALGVTRAPTVGLIVGAAVLAGLLPVMWRFLRSESASAPDPVAGRAGAS